MCQLSKNPVLRIYRHTSGRNRHTSRIFGCDKKWNSVSGCEMCTSLSVANEFLSFKEFLPILSDGCRRSLQIHPWLEDPDRTVIIRNIIVSTYKKSFERILSVMERNRNHGRFFFFKKNFSTSQRKRCGGDSRLVVPEHSSLADFLLGFFRSDVKKRGLAQDFVIGFRE
ncbi:hypothetical protein NPIL_336181 [Nephila pilipes]|uniref:Uncharacterized protein n=1 Tax=Nephila pilipes TaxID=299642 RepID=A0A8X6TX33_NEPPI|nr:hypothetical protein NPIL_336181 [Nephila pilipes]